jgi:prepilin-type N-terminal cleavage/methylation domain-containing protein
MRRRDAEDGFTLIELVVAMTVLAISALAFTTTTNNGFRLIGTSKERQMAVGLANEWTEQGRAVPYSGLALAASTSFDGAGTPDAAVSGGTTYDGDDFDPEPLVFDASATLEHYALRHPTDLDYKLYRYVTWVADGSVSHAYKRLTVVVQWTGSHGAKTLTMSTIISADGVAFNVSATTTSTTTASSTTTSTTAATTTTSTTSAGACGGDSTAPSGSLNILAGTGANTGYTGSSTVNLVLSASDPCAPITMAFSNDGSSYSSYETYATSKAWPLTSGNGNRTVYVRYKDGAGNTSVASGTIRVDTTLPTTPGSFTTASLNGPKRVSLTWTAATDNDTLVGYRIYVAKSSGSYQNLAGVTAPCTSTPCSWTHTGVKNGDVYSYYVVAYDAAGNESVATAKKTVSV